MRKIFINPKVFYFILPVLVILGIASCKKNDGGTGAPIITRVRTVSKTDTIANVLHRVTLDSSYRSNDPTVVAFDSTTNVGKLSTQYAIIGQNLGTTSAVYFNNVSAYFNSALVTDNSIIISIPANTPYTGSNKLRVVTKYGSVEFNFTIQQPPPSVTSVSQLAGNAGDQITITGTTFDGLSTVKFGTVNAVIVSKSSTQAVVTVPAGLTGANTISLTTAAASGGGTVSAPTVSGGINASNVALTNVVPFGFTQVGFDDALQNGWSDYGWSNNFNNSSTAQVKRGTNSIAVQYSGGYDGFVLQTGTAIPVSANRSIKMSLYGGKGSDGKVIHVLINDNFNTAVSVVLKEGAWTNFNIPVSAYAVSGSAAPANITNIIFQEFSGNATLFYLDDVGII